MQHVSEKSISSSVQQLFILQVPTCTPKLPAEPLHIQSIWKHT